MSNIGFEAAIVLLLLLPGFISAGIVQTFCAKRKRGEFDKVVEALLHTFIVVATFAVFVREMPLRVLTTTAGNATRYQVEVMRTPLVALLLIAVGWGVVATICVNFDWPWRWMRKLKLTHRTSQSSVWQGVFDTYGGNGYVQVELADGRFVLGYLRQYSDYATDPTLFLEDASWVGVGADGAVNVVPIAGPGILLTKASGIVHVMFLDAARKANVQDAQSRSANA